MSKLITDFATLQWSRQPTASPSLRSKNRISSNPLCDSAGYRTKLYATMATCLLTQIFSFASIANAYEEFDLLDGATPACKDCAGNNNAPTFGRTRVAMQDAYGKAPDMISDPVVEVPPAIGETVPVAIEPMQQAVNANQIPEQLFDNQQPFINPQGRQQQYVDQEGLQQQGYVAQQQLGQSPYPTQDFGQSMVSEMPVERYPSKQTYSSHQGTPSVTQQQNYAQIYTSSAPGSSDNVQPGLAQQKAVQAAQSGIQGHLGGGLGGAKYEGVGWSNYSAQSAINSCCFWGVRPTAQIGVSKGSDGFWYACVLYY